MENISKSVKALYLDRVNKMIDDDMFFQLKSDFEQELQTLKEAKQKTFSKVQQLESQLNSKEDISKVVQKYTDYSKLTHEIVNDFIDYIEIGEQNNETKEQNVIIYWNF